MYVDPFTNLIARKVFKPTYIFLGPRTSLVPTRGQKALHQIAL